jgi:hypothetical protein
VFPFTWAPFNGVISHLTAKCDGNVHDKGVVEITTSSVNEYFGTSASDVVRYALRNAAGIGTYSDIWSQNKPGQWISWDFKALRIEPTHYTIRTHNGSPNDAHLKSWAVEGSDDGASWTEIDRRENNSDLNDKLAVKTFAVARSGSFRRIRLRQTGPNHTRNNLLALSAFEVFGAVAGLQ